jgi:hypothetical protein
VVLNPSDNSGTLVSCHSQNTLLLLHWLTRVCMLHKAICMSIPRPEGSMVSLLMSRVTLTECFTQPSRPRRGKIEIIPALWHQHIRIRTMLAYWRSRLWPITCAKTASGLGSTSPHQLPPVTEVQEIRTLQIRDGDSHCGASAARSASTWFAILVRACPCTHAQYPPSPHTRQDGVFSCLQTSIS